MQVLPGNWPPAHSSDSEADAEEEGQTQPHDDAVQYGVDEIHGVVAAAVDQGVHARARGTADEDQDAYGDVSQPDRDDFGIVREAAEDRLLVIPTAAFA